MEKHNPTLVERYEQSWQAWNHALEGLDDAAFELQVYPRWRLRDIVGHVYSYTDLMRRHVQTYRKRRRLASARAPSYSYFNRREAERLKNVPLAYILGDLESAYCRLREMLPNLTADDLKKSFPSQWWNSTGRVTLRGMLREEARHIAIHAQDIEKWRVREHVGR